MATRQDLIMYEDNDETVAVTVAPADGGSLAGVTGLEFILKPDVCESDTDDDTVVLTTAGGAITITGQTADLITATVAVPRTALADPYSRAWRLDALTTAARRTAVYGSVTVIDL